jgi:hypothetical protein
MSQFSIPLSTLQNGQVVLRPYHLNPSALDFEPNIQNSSLLQAPELSSDVYSIAFKTERDHQGVLMKISLSSTTDERTNCRPYHACDGPSQQLSHTQDFITNPPPATASEACWDFLGCETSTTAVSCGSQGSPELALDALLASFPDFVATESMDDNILDALGALPINPTNPDAFPGHSPADSHHRGNFTGSHGEATVNPSYEAWQQSSSVQGSPSNSILPFSDDLLFSQTELYPNNPEVVSHSPASSSASPAMRFCNFVPEMLAHNSSDTDEDHDSEYSQTQNSPGRQGAKRRRYPCNFAGCARRFTSRYTLRIHQEAHRPKEKALFRCSAGCTESFSRQHDRLRHEVSKHGKISDWVCRRCQRFFSSSRTLDRHRCPQASNLASRSRRQ